MCHSCTGTRRALALIICRLGFGGARTIPCRHLPQRHSIHTRAHRCTNTDVVLADRHLHILGGRRIRSSSRKPLCGPRDAIGRSLIVDAVAPARNLARSSTSFARRRHALGRTAASILARHRRCLPLWRRTSVPSRTCGDSGAPCGQCSDLEDRWRLRHRRVPAQATSPPSSCRSVCSGSRCARPSQCGSR